MVIRDQVPIEGNYKDIAKRIQKDYTQSQYLWQSFWREAQTNSQLEAGIDPINYNSGILNPKQQFYINRVRPMINNVSGIQRMNRKSSIVVPLENGSQQTSDQLTKLVLGVFKRENVYHKISEAFHHGSLISGLSMLQVYIDYTQDPASGDIRVIHKPYNTFFFDPYFRDPTLKDCNFIGTRTYMTHEAAASLLPDDYYDEIMGLAGGKKGATWDGKFQYMPESHGISQANKVAYDEYYYASYREKRLLIDNETAEVLDISNMTKLDLDQYLADFPTLELIKQKVPTVKMAIMIQGKVFYDGPQPLGIDKYPFIPFFGFYNPALSTCYERIQSLCTALRDPQTLFNKQVMQNLDAFDARLNGGYMVKDGSVKDLDSLYHSGPGRVVVINKGFEMTDVHQMPPSELSQSAFTIEERRAADMNFVTGITQENMGQVADQQASGYKTRLKQLAGMSSLEPVFDSLYVSQILLSEIILDAAIVNYVPAKIKTILGEEPSPYFYNKEFGKYQCTVQMGHDTETQKQMEFAQLLELQAAIGGSTAISKALLESATIQNKDRLLEEIEKEKQEAAESNQKQMEVEIEKLRATIDLMNAQAQANRGLSLERTSRVAENQSLAVERVAQANKDDEQAALNKIKAIKELADMDLRELERLVGLANLLKQSEIEQKQETVQDVAQLQQTTPSPEQQTEQLAEGQVEPQQTF